MTTVSRTPDLLTAGEETPAFVFSTSDRLLVAARPSLSSTPDSTLGLSATVSSLKRAAPPASWVVGTLPFRGPCHVFVPETIHVGSALTEAPRAVGRPARLRSSRQVPSTAEYQHMVERALGRFEGTELRKVILARTLELELEEPLSPLQLFSRLFEKNPQSFVFSASLPSAESSSRFLVGASPELLLQKRGRFVVTHPLAGTILRPPGSDTEELGRRLLASSKDRHEHALVVEEITERLRPYCRTIEVPDSPGIVHVRHLLHLGSRIVCELTDPDVTASELVELLHPTAAVCGSPRSVARDVVAELEPFQREFFAGAVGYEEPNGDGVWALSIRCAQLEGRTLRLYAGAGIVPGSVPEREAAETENKFATLLSATLGSHSLSPRPEGVGAASAVPSEDRLPAVAVPPELAERYRASGYWRGEPLGDLLRASAARFPERVSVVCGERRLTYRELDARVDRLAAGFLRYGARVGDRVVLQLPNVLEFVECCFALFRIGVVPVMALPGHRHAEILHFCRETDAFAYVISDVHGGFDYRTIARTLDRELPSTRRKTFVVGEAAEYSSFSDLYSEPVPLPRIDARHIALLQLSGGSTGTSKLIARTHDDYFYSVRESARVCGLSEQSSYLVALPAAHNFPLSSAGILGCLFAGGKVVLCPSPNPDEAFPLVLRENVTVTALVPPLARLWLAACATRKASLRSLELLQVGGAKLERELALELTRTLDCTLQQVFGMAEGLVNYTALDDPLELIVGTQGRPLSPADELRFVDDDDRDVAPGEVGHLLTRGPYTIRSYYHPTAHDQRSFTEDGFYRTGDLVRRAPSGHLIVEGRAKDLINRGGEKIAPADVEVHLLAHDGVRDAAVVGVPDAVLGERIYAFVVAEGGARLTSPLLRAHLRARGLATFKLPDRIELCDALPKTPVGKVDTKALRARVLRDAQNPARTMRTSSTERGESPTQSYVATALSLGKSSLG